MRSFRNIWLAYSAIFVAAFLCLNLYLSWLSSKIVPFSTPVNLTESGAHFVYDLPTLASSHYTCMLDLAIPEVNTPSSLLDWDQTKAATLSSLNVELSVEIVDGAGHPVVQYEGTLDDWTLTNSGRTPGATASLYKPRFDASVFVDYELRIDVLSGSALANQFAPRFVLYGVDDGYFWLRRPVENAFVAIAAVVVAMSIGGLHFVRILRRRNMRCRNCGYSLHKLRVNRCPECGLRLRSLSPR